MLDTYAMCGLKRDWNRQGLLFFWILSGLNSPHKKWYFNFVVDDAILITFVTLRSYVLRTLIHTAFFTWFYVSNCEEVDGVYWFRLVLLSIIFSCGRDILRTIWHIQLIFSLDYSDQCWLTSGRRHQVFTEWCPFLRPETSYIQSTWKISRHFFLFY